MAYQSHTSITTPHQGTHPSFSTRPLPLRTKGHIHHSQPKRPLPPDKTAPQSPKKFMPPRINFSKSTSTHKSPPIPSRINRPKSPRKIALTRPLSARKHNNNPPSHSLPNKPQSKTYKNTKNSFRSQVYFIDPLTANLEKNHNKFTFVNTTSCRNIFAVQNNTINKPKITPPQINTNTTNTQTTNSNSKHIAKSQSHSPLRSNGFNSYSPIHRATKSVQINNKFPKQNTMNKMNKKNKKLPHNKLFNDTNFTEADLKCDDSDCNNEIYWIRGECIGTGAFGKVYKGYDKRTGRKCAIKQIPYIPNTKIKNKKELIDREAEIMRQLKHENIVEFYGYQTSIKYKTLIILMELVIGITIEEYYHKNGYFSEGLISKYVKQIMYGLEFAHKMNIIHRDIKGKNILINNKGVIKLADFGSAKLHTDTSISEMALQPSMDFSTTALWTAPEVLHNNGYNHKIDIWSVGCVIIEMATAKQPWSECKFDNPFAALYHIGQSDNIPKYPKRLSKLCKDFIKLCLVRDVNKRCSASELLRHEFLDYK
eukprot:8155_1